MIYIPDELWIGNKEDHQELIEEFFATDDFREGEHEKLIAKMIKGLRDEPLVLEYLEIY